MTKRYFVVDDLYQWMVRQGDGKYAWDGICVATFESKSRAESYCAELKREEEAKSTSVAEQDLADWMGDGSWKARLADACKASVAQYQRDQVVYDKVMRTLDEYLVDTQHKDAIPPPAMVTNRTDPEPSDALQQLHRLANTINGRVIGSSSSGKERHAYVIPEKPQPTSDGERVRCCRAHADPVFMFNDEVWRGLKNDCGGRR